MTGATRIKETADASERYPGLEPGQLAIALLNDYLKTGTMQRLWPLIELAKSASIEGRTPLSAAEKPLPTIWRVPDELWERLEPVLLERYPPARTGRPRADLRRVCDGIIYRLRTGCQWNQLPREFGDDSTVHRWFQRFVADGAFEALWARLASECEALGDLDWSWQAADGMMGKARMGGEKGDPTPLIEPSRAPRRACSSSAPAAPWAWRSRAQTSTTPNCSHSRSTRLCSSAPTPRGSPSTSALIRPTTTPPVRLPAEPPATSPTFAVSARRSSTPQVPGATPPAAGSSSAPSPGCPSVARSLSATISSPPTTVG
jgi:transposase